MINGNTQTSTVTIKGQVTIPAELREKLNIKPADRVIFVEEDGRLRMKPLPTMEALAGSLQNNDVEPLSSTKLREIRQKGAVFSKKR